MVASLDEEKKPEVTSNDTEPLPAPLKGAVIYSSERISYTAEERRVIRKIDMNILPFMLIAYMLQFLDKQALSNSTIMGIIQDLELYGTKYSWAVSMFYFGYLLASYPVLMMLVKLPLGKSLATVFIVWAIILGCHAATKNFAGLMVARFFLGVAEASISPGFSLITSLWYRTSEQPLRHGLWFASNSASGIFASIMAWGIYHIHDALKPWQWLFIIMALATYIRLGPDASLALARSPRDG
ncbi:uncharacterized protein N7496_006892 [Penicillium cataractarum]|uniref:Major facilitator superfamily (MFS) profile domain-containing protein n=1 Tax=Penicillium cataractarum TaxID=2100454 RepID=A0A9W9S3R9_9EURO|nr:uncharacterized protein N7496_006892 [Penicillium cataractarum]KAJ5370800.1 hypothetical protein N7496_006892 [Penicillium cataractarum]